jgi:chromosome segregation ATPase
MSNMSREDKLFRNELQVLEYYKSLNKEDQTLQETKAALDDLTRKYKSLLEQTRFLTWISGRLERKLQRTNRELQNNNAALQKTLNELTKAEAGKSAYAIIYTIAIVLFVLEEFFVEPVINMFGNTIGYSIIFKSAIVLILKASETLIEKKVMRARKARGTLAPSKVPAFDPSPK